MPSLRFAAAVLLALLCGVAAAAAAAQNDAPPPGKPAPPVGFATPAPLKPGDAFGESVTLPERTIVYLQGRSEWTSALETLIDSFNSLRDYLTKSDIAAAGPFMTVFTETNDSGFRFRAAAPIAEAPKNPPKGDIAVGQAPSGKALKFVHRGSYDAMDSTYEAITNYLDDKGLEARDEFVEEYVSGPLPPDGHDLVVNIFVPVK